MLIPDASIPVHATDPCLAGSGRLDFEKVGQLTVVRTAFARSPLRLLNPRNRGHASWVYMSSLGGGLVGGDSLDLRIHVRPGAEAVLLSQSSTKVYRSSLESSQSIEARVEQDAVLISIPDPTVCFVGIPVKQTQKFDLESGASLLMLDTFHCGRQASGERWLFDRFRNRIEVRRKGHPVFMESLLLDERAGKISERISRFNVFSLILMLGPRFEEDGKLLLSSQSDQPIGSRVDLIVTASPLSTEGVMVRIAGVSTEEVSKALRRFLHFVPEKLGDNPWARKW